AQRLTIFQFYLIILALCVTSILYGTRLMNAPFDYQVHISVIGFLLTSLFFFIEIRTGELLHMATDALREIELELMKTTAFNIGFCQQSERPKRSYARYRIVIRIFYISALLLFALAFIDGVGLLACIDVQLVKSAAAAR
ncbi:MAG: hypothetical protein P8X52_12185, partial [Limibacillus sp.]